MNNDTCINCGSAAKRRNPDCGDHRTTPASAPAKPIETDSVEAEQIVVDIWNHYVKTTGTKLPPATRKRFSAAIEALIAAARRDELEALDRDAMRVLHKDGFRDCIDAGIVRRRLKALTKVHQD